MWGYGQGRDCSRLGEVAGLMNAVMNIWFQKVWELLD